MKFKLSLIMGAILAQVGLAYAATGDVNVEDGFALNNKNLYVVVNTSDPSSVALGDYYMKARGIPSANIIKVIMPVRPQIGPAEAQDLLNKIAANKDAKGFALAWSMPYKVGSNQSVTSFVSNGPVNPLVFTSTCNSTPNNPYFDTGIAVDKASAPINFRPSMLLASYTSSVPRKDGSFITPDSTMLTDATKMNSYLAGIKQTIGKGISSDFSKPVGTAYFLKTTDAIRTGPRQVSMDYAKTLFGSYTNISVLSSNNTGGKKDILMELTGLPVFYPAEGGAANFLPGAVGDSLTSFSGSLYYTYGQTSALEFLRAGTTASYGTVREPCAYGEKFPKPETLTRYIVSGDTIAEAYWKSVLWPTEGLFIGEPLARPYSKMTITDVAGGATIFNKSARPGYYDIYSSDAKVASRVLLEQKKTSTVIPYLSVGKPIKAVLVEATAINPRISSLK